MLLLIFRGSRTPPPPPPPPPPGIDPLSPQYLGRPNVYFKLGFGRRKEERPPPPPPPPVQRAKPSALLLGLVGRIEAPLPVKPAAAALLAPQIKVPAKPKRKAKPTIVLPPAPKPQAPEPSPVDTSQAELRAALREELNAAADEARARLALRRDLTAELHGFAEAMALRLDLERELRDAQKWAEGRIKRRRRQRAAALAVMLLSE